MTFKLKSDGRWYKNAAGLWVQSEPIDKTLVAAASTGQVVAKASDGTLELITVSGSGGSRYDVDVPDASPSSETDEFSGDTTAFDAAYSKVNWSGLTDYNVNSQKPGSLWVKNPQNGSGTFTQRHALKALPSGDCTVVSRLHHAGVSPTGASGGFVGIALTDGVTAGSGNQVVAFLQTNTTDGQYRIYVGKYSGFTGGASSLLVASSDWGQRSVVMRFRRAGSSYDVGFSMDGRTWRIVGFSPGFTPSFFGVATRNDNTGESLEASWDFLRYYDDATSETGGLG